MAGSNKTPPGGVMADRVEAVGGAGQVVDKKVSYIK